MRVLLEKGAVERERTRGAWRRSPRSHAPTDLSPINSRQTRLSSSLPCPLLTKTRRKTRKWDDLEGDTKEWRGRRPDPSSSSPPMSSFFPSYNVANMDFNDDDLVGLVSSERSTTTKQSQSNGQSHPHNIFDISAPAYTNPPYHFSPHFNSTIPPLASYDEQNGHLAHSHTHSHLSRSRSRSRPPSIGPTRSRRGNSISSTSPPPHSRPNPSHIMIPSSRAHQASSPPPPSSALSTGGWYIPPTPDSIGNPHSLPYTHYDDASSGLPASFPNFSPVQSPTSAGGVGGSVQDKQSLLANEKRRRRRESHNAVERRRRDNINEKITELATLIPECLLEGATPNGSTTAQAASSPPAPDEIWGGLLKEDGGSPPSGSMPELVPGANNVNGGVIKANKGMILTKSVEYIR